MTYAMQVNLTDPLKLREYGVIDPSTALIIYGLVQGDFAEHGANDPDVWSRVVDSNIVTLTHFRKQGERLLQATDGKEEHLGFALFAYCGRCGRQFSGPTSCGTCKIEFELKFEHDRVYGRIPTIPAKVVAYALQHGHRFAIKPPQA